MGFVLDADPNPTMLGVVVSMAAGVTPAGTARTAGPPARGHLSAETKGEGPVLTARTLAEADIYVNLGTAADETLSMAPPERAIIEGEQAWTVRTPFGDIAVPYVSEHVARTVGATFGIGVSRLIDAGQWIVVANSFESLALEALMEYTARPGQDPTAVELNWQSATEAIGEAIKFLPEGADRLPERAFWSALGLKLLREDPDHISRARLVDNQEYYAGVLEDFRAYGQMP
ncbi:hypothetical protein [Pseudonocardia sp. DLS-67]